MSHSGLLVFKETLQADGKPEGFWTQCKFVRVAYSFLYSFPCMRYTAPVLTSVSELFRHLTKNPARDRK